MTKKQIFLIHGGNTFRAKKDYLQYLKKRSVYLKKVKWTDEYLEKKLGKQYDIIRPRMPLQDNAKYEEWKITFERYIPLLKPGVILIGGSLGGIFLAKYLSENKFPKKIGSTFLICPPYDNTLPGEELTGGFKLKSSLSLIQKNSPNLYLLFSKNDNVVPVAHAEKYRAKLPDANIIVYPHIKGHFLISEFPEIVNIIKKLRN